MKARIIIIISILVVSFSCTNLTKSEKNSKNSTEKKTEVLESKKENNLLEKTTPDKETALNKQDSTKIIFFTNNYYVISLTSFFFGLIIGAFIVYYYSRSEIYKILKKEKHYYSMVLKDYKRCGVFKYIKLVEQLKESKDQKKIEIEELKKQETRNETNLTNDNFVKMHNSNFSINDTVVEKKNDLEIIEEENPNVIIWKVDEKDKISELFFTIPFDDGSFFETHKTESKEPDSFYKIRIIEKNKGELHFLSSEYDKTALDNISGYLSPVCSIENIEKRLTANRISMKEPGEVTLFNGTWKININKKVIIELI